MNAGPALTWIVEAASGRMVDVVADRDAVDGPGAAWRRAVTAIDDEHAWVALPDGSIRILGVWTMPIDDRQARIIATDRTDAWLAQAGAIAAAQLAAADRIAERVAHDVNNPLSAIAALAHVIASGARRRGDAALAEDAAGIGDAVRAAARVARYGLGTSSDPAEALRNDVAWLRCWLGPRVQVDGAVAGDAARPRGQVRLATLVAARLAPAAERLAIDVGGGAVRVRTGRGVSVALDGDQPSLVLEP
jgi:hypothetical protein